MQIDPLLYDLMINAIVAIFFTAGGALGKKGYDWYYKRYKLRHMRNVFGDIDDLTGQVRFVLPRFKPLTYDDFDDTCERSWVLKDYITNKAGSMLEDLRVPLYSEVLVIDDYLAFKHVENLFIEHGYDPLEFCDDVKALQDWKKRLIMSFGGPRSNQKLRQILNLDESQFFNIDDLGDLLSDWKLICSVGGQSIDVRASEDIAYAFILKIRNPFFPEGRIVAIAGDSSYGTDMAARYLHENLVEISNEFEKNDFLLVLKSNRNMYETVQPCAQLTLDGDCYAPPAKTP